MIISLVWLIFYYVQRFRYLQTKDRKSVRPHLVHFLGMWILINFSTRSASTVQRCEAHHRQDTNEEHQIGRQADRARLLCDLHRDVQGDGFDSHAAVPVSTDELCFMED